MGTPEERAAATLQLHQAQASALGQQATTAAERQNLAAAQEVCHKLDLYANSIGTVDGMNRDQLRSWLEHVDYAMDWTGASDKEGLEMIGYLMSGSLAIYVRSHLRQNPDEQTWPKVRAAISKAYLEEDEDEFLREPAERTNQRPFEDTREFGRRFQEVVRKAYPTSEPAVPLVRDRVVKLFIKDIQDADVRMQVHLIKPTTLADAVSSANTTAHARSLAEIPSTRQEEPMEVGAFKVTPPAELSLSMSEMASGLSALREEVSFLKKQIQRGSSAAVDEGVARSMESIRGGRRDISRMKCYKCEIFGHIKRDCPEVRFKKVEAAIAAFSNTPSRGGIRCRRSTHVCLFTGCPSAHACFNWLWCLP